MQLAEKGIPKRDSGGWDILEKPSLGVSDFMLRVNYRRALQGELARTISELDEVESARVMLTMPENGLLIPTSKPTASVFVKVRRQGQLPMSSVNSIRFLVASSVEGLQPNNVTVVDNHGTPMTENNEPDSMAGLTSAQLGLRKQIEQYYANKAQTMLEAVLGPGRALVRVSADINFETLTKTSEVYDPEGVLREDTKKDEKLDSNNGSNNPAVGATVNAGTNAAAQASVNVTKNNTTTSTKKFELSKTTSTLLQQPGSLRRLSAAIMVAQKVEGSG
jgi:flagellar M-ring protein FliF